MLHEGGEGEEGGKGEGGKGGGGGEGGRGVGEQEKEGYIEWDEHENRKTGGRREGEGGKEGGERENRREGNEGRAVREEKHNNIGTHVMYIARGRVLCNSN